LLKKNAVSPHEQMFEHPLAFVYSSCYIDGVERNKKMKFTLSNKSKFLVNAKQAEAGVNNLQRPHVRELYE